MDWKLLDYNVVKRKGRYYLAVYYYLSRNFRLKREGKKG